MAEEQWTAAERLDVMPGEQRRAVLLQPAAEPVQGHVADRNETLLVALADHPDVPALGREVLAIEADRLAHPKPGGVQQLEERPAAEIGRGLQERLDLGHVQGLGQEPRLARKVDVGGDVAGDQPVAVGEPVEAADAGRAAPERGRGEAGVARSAPFRPLREMAAGGLGAIGPGRRHVASRREVREVAAVCPDRRRGQPALDPEISQVVLDRPVKRRSRDIRRWRRHVDHQTAARVRARHASARSSSSRADASAAAPPPAS